MAVKKKKPAKKTAKKAKRSAKPAARKPAPKKAKKAKAKKSLLARAVGRVSSLLKGGKKKKPANREYGEGNYKASKRFRTEQETFVRKNKAKIPALGKAAEDALAGPEGDELRAAEASAAGHAKD